MRGLPEHIFAEGIQHVPFVIFYGDHIAEEPTDNYDSDQWRAKIAMGRRFAELVNKYGGDAAVIHLPELGFVRNVKAPTLIPYLPDSAKSNGAAIIIAPGGAFLHHTFGSGGYEAAEWFRSQRELRSCNT